MRKLTELIHLKSFLWKMYRNKKTISEITQLLYRSWPNSAPDSGSLGQGAACCRLCVARRQCGSTQKGLVMTALGVYTHSEHLGTEHLCLAEQTQLLHTLFRQSLAQNWPKSLTFIIGHYLFITVSVLNRPDTHIHT